MKKVKFFWGCLFFVLMTGLGTANAWIDWGTEGVADTERVQNILQVTDNQYNDVAQCWGSNPWRSDGGRIVYTSMIDGTSHDNNEICTINPDGTGYQQLTNNEVCDSHASFIPGGLRIVFQRRSDTGYGEIWIMNSDGTNQQNLTQAHWGPVCDDCCENKPMVSPDGSKIAFHTCDRDIWVMNIDGSNPVKVSGEIDRCTKHTWSPDSMWVLFNGRSQVHEDYCKIYKAPADGSSRGIDARRGADGGGPVMLSEDVDGVCENWAFLSPDGQWIAYHTRSDGDTTLSIMRYDGTYKRVLVQEEENGDYLDWVCGPKSWSPNSKWIAFKRYGGDESSIFVINIDTGEEIRLTKDYDDRRLWWSPDGSRILFRDAWSNSRDDLLDLDRDLLVINFDPEYVSLFARSVGVRSRR